MNLITILLALAAYGPDLPAGPTVEEVLRANATHVMQTKSGEVTYSLEFTYPKESQESRKATAERYKNRPEQLEPTLKTKDLNTSRHERVTVFFDDDAQAYKVVSKDVRDLDLLAKRENLPPAWKSTLDSSQTILSGNGIRLTLLGNIKNVLVREFKTTQPASMLMSAKLWPGVISQYAFANATQKSIASCSYEGRDVQCLTLGSESNRYEFEVDAAIGYRFLRQRSYDKEGRLRQLITLGDYRLVDGVHYPFKCEEINYGTDGSPTFHDVVRVTEARFNKPLPPDALQMTLPAGTQLLGAPPLPGELGTFKAERVVKSGELEKLIAAQSAEATRQR